MTQLSTKTRLDDHFLCKQLWQGSKPTRFCIIPLLLKVVRLQIDARRDTRRVTCHRDNLTMNTIKNCIQHKNHHVQCWKWSIVAPWSSRISFNACVSTRYGFSNWYVASSMKLTLPAQWSSQSTKSDLVMLKLHLDYLQVENSSCNAHWGTHSLNEFLVHN